MYCCLNPARPFALGPCEQDLDMELLEEYALDDELDFLDGTNISEDTEGAGPSNVSDVRGRTMMTCTGRDGCGPCVCGVLFES